MTQAEGDDALRSLEALRAFDPDGAKLIDRLVAAGLDEKANTRREELARALEAAKVDLAAARAKLRERGAVEPSEVEVAAVRGDVRHARRLAERALSDHEAAERSPTSRWALSLADRARDRSIALTPDLARRVRGLKQLDPARSVGEARALAADLSRALYDEALSGARATVAIARVRDNLPETAGPYNPQVIAAEALDRLGTMSPGFAAAFIAALDDLATLDALAAPASASKAKSKSGTTRRRTR